eukprot:131110_1
MAGAPSAAPIPAVPSINACRDASERTVPMGAYPGLARSLRKMCCPVWPPEPVTKTRRPSMASAVEGGTNADSRRNFTTVFIVIQCRD